jgi:hypothetical protein
MYTVSVLAMFKNESWIIKEWIKHYLTEEVEHFYLIDNGSTDNYRDKIKEYMEYITLIIDPTRLPSGNTQSFLYKKHYLNKIKEETEWILVCDIDEYVYSRKNYKTISNFLKNVPKNIEKIWIPWKIFGSNNHKNQPDNIVKSFIKRGNSVKQEFGLGKCIARTKNLINFGCCGHNIQLTKNNFPYYPNLKIILKNDNLKELNNLDSHFLHLNHYMTMSEEYYREIKCKRGGGESGIIYKYTIKYFYDNQKIYNSIQDTELFNKKNLNQTNKNKDNNNDNNINNDNNQNNDLIFKINDKNLFKKYIEKCNYYFEFGSGSSTNFAYNQSNIKKIITVESDVEWYNKFQNINNNKFNIIFVDLKVEKKKLGYPGSNSKLEDWILYSDSLKNIDKNIQEKIDLILIDGRFRVACCLKCHKIINNDCIILFNDFMYRKNYHEVLNYFSIIDKTIDNSMVALKKKPNLIPSDKLIQKYESIKD